MQVSLDQFDKVFPPLIAAMVREVAEELSLESVEFVPRREYNPASAPLFHYFGRRDARIYMSGAACYLSIADMTLDFFPIATGAGKELIAPNECWVLESGRDDESPEGEEGDYFLIVSCCVDLTQDDGGVGGSGNAHGESAEGPQPQGWEALVLDLATAKLHYGRESVGTDYLCACDAAGHLIPRCYWDRQEMVDLGERAPDLVIGALVRAQVPIADPARVVEAVERVLAASPTLPTELASREGE